MNTPLRIDWIVSGVSFDSEGLPQSDLASNRYRAIIPSQQMEMSGHAVRLVDARTWRFDGGTGKPDLIIIGKLLPSSANPSEFHTLATSVLSNVQSARAAGVPTVADVNDDHFGNPHTGFYWRALVSSVCGCVVGSEAMEDVVRRQSKVPTFVIGDPVAAPAGVARPITSGSWLSKAVGKLLGPRSASDRVKFVWYGNPTNFPPLQAWARQLAELRDEVPFLIWLVTRPNTQIQSWVDSFNAQFAPAGFVELVEWSESSQWDTVRDADIVLIPSDTAHEHLRVKTANRLVDALWSRRAVVASALPSYSPYGDFVWLTENPVSAVRDILARPDKAAQRIEDGCQLIAQTAAPEVVGQQWTKTLHTARALPYLDSAASVALPDAPIRLNLGCGDKILSGYVNVDVVESRAGKKPDVLSDLHDLSVFSDNYADEILSVHVVEHFWRWEIQAVLSEWIRVLKPGGAMIIECPNLLSACQEFVQNPVLRSSEGKDGQRTMWVFYGDPAWQDPYMIHRWGYTPDSLASLLTSCGLVAVRQEPAQYKLREPRDMRLVAIKPTNWQSRHSKAPMGPNTHIKSPGAPPFEQLPASALVARPTFGELFYAHHGNKSSKWTHYLEVYQRYFAPFRDKPCRILEIGVQNGGSLSLYQKYFPQAAQIVGVDIDPRCSGLAGGNIAIEIGSQADGAFLQSVCNRYGPFDIVVDDGSHVFSHQRLSFETIFPRMREDGVYIAEDIHSSYAPSFGGGLNVADSFVSYCKALTDQVNAPFFPDLSDRQAWLADHLFAVAYYDSMIVLERRPKQSPYSVTVGEAGHVKTPDRQDVAYFRSKHYR